MPLLPLAAAAAVVASLTVLVWSVTAARSAHRATATNLVRGHDRTDLRTLVLERSAHDRAVRPLALWLADVGRRLSRTSSRARLERLLRSLGESSREGIERLLAQKVMMATVGVLLGLLVLADRQGITAVLMALALPATGWAVPDSLLRAR